MNQKTRKQRRNTIRRRNNNKRRQRKTRVKGGSNSGVDPRLHTETIKYCKDLLKDNEIKFMLEAIIKLTNLDRIKDIDTKKLYNALIELQSDRIYDYDVLIPHINHLALLINYIEFCDENKLIIRQLRSDQPVNAAFTPLKKDPFTGLTRSLTNDEPHERVPLLQPSPANPISQMPPPPLLGL